MKLIRKYRSILISAMLLALWTLAGASWMFGPQIAWYARLACYPAILLGVVALASIFAERPSS